MSQLSSLKKEQYAYYLRLFRNARYQVLADGENFTNVCFALEEFGTALLRKKQTGLGGYKNVLVKFLGDDAYSKKFDTTFEKLKSARNGKSHQGVFARHAARNAVKICIMIEEKITEQMETLEDLMVDEIIWAQEFMPVAKIREMMLRYSFSYLPFKWEDKYYLIADYQIAHIWKNLDYRDKYTTPFSQIFSEKFEESDPTMKRINTEPFDKEKEINKLPIPTQPILIKDTENHIVGIITPFDFL